LAASTSPVSRSATSQDAAGTAGGGGTSPAVTTSGPVPSRSPPTGPENGPPATAADAGPATTNAMVAATVRKARIPGTLERRRSFGDREVRRGRRPHVVHAAALTEGELRVTGVVRVVHVVVDRVQTRQRARVPAFWASAGSSGAAGASRLRATEPRANPPDWEANAAWAGTCSSAVELSNHATDDLASITLGGTSR
jgi:hypothetical protein